MKKFIFILFYFYSALILAGTEIKNSDGTYTVIHNDGSSTTYKSEAEVLSKEYPNRNNNSQSIHPKTYTPRSSTFDNQLYR
jgi:hypothetical protein